MNLPKWIKVLIISIPHANRSMSVVLESTVRCTAAHPNQWLGWKSQSAHTCDTSTTLKPFLSQVSHWYIPSRSTDALQWHSGISSRFKYNPHSSSALHCWPRQFEQLCRWLKQAESCAKATPAHSTPVLCQAEIKAAWAPHVCIHKAPFLRMWNFPLQHSSLIKPV